MSIWASLEAPDDDSHEEGCTIYKERRYPDGFIVCDFSGKPCNCGQPDAPLVYQGSNVLPDLDGERGGSVDLAIILPHVRYWRENPDAPVEDEPDSSTHPIEPFLRFGVNDETVVLTRPQVERVVNELRWFLDKSRPLRMAS